MAVRRPRALTLIGSKDSLVDPICSEKVAAFLGADVRRHPDSNHDMATDAPDWLVETVGRWLNETPAP